MTPWPRCRRLPRLPVDPTIRWRSKAWTNFPDRTGTQGGGRCRGQRGTPSLSRTMPTARSSASPSLRSVAQARARRSRGTSSPVTSGRATSAAWARRSASSRAARNAWAASVTGRDTPGPASSCGGKRSSRGIFTGPAAARVLIREEKALPGSWLSASAGAPRSSRRRCSPGAGSASPRRRWGLSRPSGQHPHLARSFISARTWPSCFPGIRPSISPSRASPPGRPSGAGLRSTSGPSPTNSRSAKPVSGTAGRSIGPTSRTTKGSSPTSCH